jgi:hypothetical protein
MKEELAYAILNLLKEHELICGVRIFFNNKCFTGDVAIESQKGSDYFKYATDDTISMSFEGDLCDVLNYRHGELSDKVISELLSLLGSYGLFYELGEHWNLGTYYIDEEPPEELKDDTEGENPQNPIYIRKSLCPSELEPIRTEWERRQNEYGDVGSTVRCAAFTFKFKDTYYRMPPQGQWQGSCSWESSVDEIKHLLEQAGCENVKYHYGELD